MTARLSAPLAQSPGSILPPPQVGQFTENYSWSSHARDYIHVYAREPEDVPAPLLAKLMCMEMRGDRDAFGVKDVLCSCHTWNSVIVPEDPSISDDEGGLLGEGALLREPVEELAFGEYGDVAGEQGIAWP